MPVRTSAWQTRYENLGMKLGYESGHTQLQRTDWHSVAGVELSSTCGGSTSGCSSRRGSRVHDRGDTGDDQSCLLTKHFDGRCCANCLTSNILEGDRALPTSRTRTRNTLREPHVPWQRCHSYDRLRQQKCLRLVRLITKEGGSPV